MEKEKDKIEEAGILAVRQYLLRCPRIKPVIYDNDKTQFWDGDINIYKDEAKDNKKDNFHGRVPVQVKGRSDTTKEFRIGRADAEAYKNDGGCLFFKVLVGENYSTTILYAFLSSAYLNTLLKQTTQTIKIDLQEVPSNPLDFEKELYAFAANRNSEKVENTSPKEIKKLVDRFEGLRGHLKEIEDKNVRAKLKTHLDSIKNLSKDTQDDDTIGWRDSFYYCSREAIDLAINNIKGHNFVYLQHILGIYLYDQKQYHLVEDYYLKSLHEYRKLSDIVNVAITLNNLGLLHDDLKRYDEAEKEYKEALEIYRELAQTNRDAYISYVATTLNNLAILHKNITRYDKAEKEYKEALEIRRELAKINRDAYIGDVAMTLNNLGLMHYDLKRYDEAEEEYKEALEIRRELAKANRDPYSWDLANTLNNYGELYQALARQEEAESYYKEALVIKRELVRVNREANIEYLAEILYNYASLLQEATDRKDEAKKTAEEALDIFKELAKAYPQIWKSRVEKTERLLKALSK